MKRFEYRELRPNLVLLESPCEDKLEVWSRLQNISQTRVIILLFTRPEYAMRALRAGAAGLLRALPAGTEHAITLSLRAYLSRHRFPEALLNTQSGTPQDLLASLPAGNARS